MTRSFSAWALFSVLMTLVYGIAIFGCSSPTAPTGTPQPEPSFPVRIVTPVSPLPVPGISCPTDKPRGLTVGQVQGRTDIAWEQVGALTQYLVWIAVDTEVPWPLVAGAPATATGTRYEWHGADPARTYAVRVQSACGGQLSDAVVFGGRSGPMVPPVPPPPVPRCTGKGCLSR